MRTTMITVWALSLLIFPTVSASSDLPTKAPEGASPLTGDQIRALLGGGTNFNFVGVGTPISGTGYWNMETGTAYGAFQIDNKIKGNWGFPWFINGNKNCLRYSAAKTVCTHIYRHGNGGFMEVNLDGTVHTVYTPVRPQLLPVPLVSENVRDLLAHFLVWNQEPEISVAGVSSHGDNLIAEFVNADGSIAWTLLIDRTTGHSRTHPEETN